MDVTMCGKTGPNPAVGRPLGQARQGGVHETGSESDDAVEHASLPRGSNPANEGVLQVIAKASPEGGRVGPQRQTMERGSGEFHERDFLAGNSRRARAAATCPSSRAASCAATFRPCAVMR